jgi:hypothetical protein
MPNHYARAHPTLLSDTHHIVQQVRSNRLALRDALYAMLLLGIWLIAPAAIAQESGRVFESDSSPGWNSGTIFYTQKDIIDDIDNSIIVPIHGNNHQLVVRDQYIDEDKVFYNVWIAPTHPVVGNWSYRVFITDYPTLESAKNQILAETPSDAGCPASFFTQEPTA